MSKIDERQKQFIAAEQRMSSLLRGLPFRFTSRPQELRQLESAYREISRLAMSVAKLAEEAAADASTGVPVLEPE